MKAAPSTSGRRGVQAVVLAEEHRGPATALSERILEFMQAAIGVSLLRTDRQKSRRGISQRRSRWSRKWPKDGDAVSREILVGCGRVACVDSRRAWQTNSAGAIAKSRSRKSAACYGRSKYFDSAIDAEVKKADACGPSLFPCKSPLRRPPCAWPCVWPARREMPPESEARIAHARSASGEELKSLVHEAGEEMLLALLENPNLEEPHVTLLLERLDLPANVLGAVAGRRKWTSSEGVRLRLARHPRTPKRFALAAVRQLYPFRPCAAEPAAVRARRYPPRRRRDDLDARAASPDRREIDARSSRPFARGWGGPRRGPPQAVKLALTNPFLTESQVLKVLAKPGLPERVVAAIAHHPKWSCQYNVRAALVRNPHTPLPPSCAIPAAIDARRLKTDGETRRPRSASEKTLSAKSCCAAPNIPEEAESGSASARNRLKAWRKSQITFGGSSRSERSFSSASSTYSTLQQTREQYEVCVDI